MSHFVKLSDDAWINRELVSEVGVVMNGNGTAWLVKYYVPGVEQAVAHTAHPSGSEAHAAVERFLKD